MPNRPPNPCGHRAEVEALARGELEGAVREQTEHHLARCAGCRSHYRQLTGRRYPRIRNYTILSELGRGGFGVVYKAVHHSKERFEAIKVLFGKTAQREAYFENEVRLAARLRHPNIATLFDAHLKTPPLYYAMEFVQGQQLHRYLRHNEVSLEQRIDLLRTVALAMGYAHRQGVIHRDLKPQNILIDPQRQPRIVDFGIAKRLVVERDAETPDVDADRTTEGALGTFGYMAPEQMGGQEVDWRADIYALGALLFHLVTGHSARFATHLEHLTAALRERQVARAADLAAIIACCVHPDAAQRYADCESLVADLDRYVAGRPIQARHASPPGYRVARIVGLTARNHPWSVQAAAITAMVVLLSAIFWLNGAHWHPARTPTQRTALIGILPSTVAAIRSGELQADRPGLTAENRKSWRLLYGRLMEKLGPARPAVVVWDFYFPDCYPEFDERFVEGLRAVGAPVIVGAQNADQNGDPALCPAIRDAVHAWGLLSAAAPAQTEGAVHIPLAVQRGHAPAMPALSLAALAAFRRPDCDVAVDVTPTALRLRHRKRELAAGELRWHEDPHPVPIFKTEVAAPWQPHAMPGDRFHFSRFALPTLAPWAREPRPLEDVLAADTDQLRRWFEGRAVLIGLMLPMSDQCPLGNGEIVFGSQVQAMVLDDLLNEAALERFGRPQIVLVVLLSCVAAGLAVNLVPLGTRARMRSIGPPTAAAALLVLTTAYFVTREPLVPWALTVTVLACSLVGGAAATLLVRLWHQRQLHLTPEPAWSADDGTASTTVLASPLGETPASTR